MMPVAINNAYGQIDISADVIAKIAGGAALDCPGIVGMASRNQLKDGFAELLRKDNSSKGVIVRFDDDQNLTIDMYIIVSYGSKIAEVAVNIQNKVQDSLNRMLGFKAVAINIYVQGVRITDEEENPETSLQ